MYITHIQFQLTIQNVDVKIEYSFVFYSQRTGLNRYRWLIVQSHNLLSMNVCVFNIFYKYKVSKSSRKTTAALITRGNFYVDKNYLMTYI